MSKSDDCLGQDVCHQVTWTTSATGDRFPTAVDATHPLWQSFLDSGCISPTHFFRAFLSPPAYFQSPTPWRAHGRLAHKVAELLDSFRPGSASYRPFKKDNLKDVDSSTQTSGDTYTTNTDNVNDDSVESRHTRNNSVRARTDLEDVVAGEAEVHDSNNGVRVSQAQDVRSRLYVDLGRPRPFYRRSSTAHTSTTSVTTSAGQGDGRQCHRVQHEPKSLQDLVRTFLVSQFGLDRLKIILTSDSLSLIVPSIIRDQLLTFLCQDFEEISQIFETPNSPGLARRSVSYKVRCLLDNADYLAVYATSEVDKHVSNVWDEYRDWLYMDADNVDPILALVADTLTQNVFFIVKDPPKTTLTAQQNENRHNLLNEAKAKFEDDLKATKLPQDLLRPEWLTVITDGTLRLPNPLLFPSFRVKLKSVCDVNNNSSNGKDSKCKSTSNVASRNCDHDAQFKSSRDVFRDLVHFFSTKPL